MSEWREVRTIFRLSESGHNRVSDDLRSHCARRSNTRSRDEVLFAALLYIYRVSQTTTVALVTEEYIEGGRPHVLQDKLLPPYVLVLRVHVPFLFGATKKLSEATVDMDSLPPVVILRLKNMTAIYAIGLHELERLAERLRAMG